VRRGILLALSSRPLRVSEQRVSLLLGTALLAASTPVAADPGAAAPGAGAADMVQAAAPPPVVDETWLGLDLPEVGEGSPSLTVVLRGAPRDAPLSARMGTVEGRLEHMGLAVFAVRLRGVPAEGRLLLRDEDRTLWSGEVLAGDDALVSLSWAGAHDRIERLPAAPDPPPPPPEQGWRRGLAGLWLLAGLVSFGLSLRGGHGRGTVASEQP